MSRRLSIPLLVDSITIDRLSDATEIDAHPAVSRGVNRGISHFGRLINRLRLSRIVDVMAVEGRMLPVFLAREDEERAAEQRALEAKLNSLLAEGRGWQPEEIIELSGLVRAGGDETRIGVVVQGLLGRIFIEDYQATRHSYEAARIVGAWPRVGMLKALWWRLTGRSGAHAMKFGVLRETTGFAFTRRRSRCTTSSTPYWSWRGSMRIR